MPKATRASGVAVVWLVCNLLTGRNSRPPYSFAMDRAKERDTQQFMVRNSALAFGVNQLWACLVDLVSVGAGPFPVPLGSGSHQALHG